MEENNRPSNIVPPGQSLDSMIKRSFFERRIHDPMFGRCKCCMIGRVCFTLALYLLLLPLYIIERFF